MVLLFSKCFLVGWMGFNIAMVVEQLLVALVWGWEGYGSHNELHLLAKSSKGVGVTRRCLSFRQHIGDA